MSGRRIDGVRNKIIRCGVKFVGKGRCEDAKLVWSLKMSDERIVKKCKKREWKEKNFWRAAFQASVSYSDLVTFYETRRKTAWVFL